MTRRMIRAVRSLSTVLERSNRWLDAAIESLERADWNLRESSAPAPVQWAGRVAIGIAGVTLTIIPAVLAIAGLAVVCGVGLIAFVLFVSVVDDVLRVLGR